MMSGRRGTGAAFLRKHRDNVSVNTHPRPWIDAWHDALYGEAGFYRRDEGPAGHFATSAQGIPGVADVLAQAVLAYAERCDAEVVVDFACGRGELLEALARFADPSLELVGVDVVARPDAVGDRIAWVQSPGAAAVPDFDFLDGRRALVVAHEWLDVVPCTVAEADDDGVLRSVLVAHDGTESVGEPLTEPELDWVRRWWRPQHDTSDATSSPGPDAAETHLPGERVEVGLTRDRAWSYLIENVSRHATPGSVLVGVDYGHTRATRPPLGTLTGFREGAECTPIPDGSCDVTAHVAVDSLDADHVTTQRAVMLDLFGEEPLEPVPLDLAHTAPPAYLQRLAVRSALAAAVSPDGLGAFFWWVREIR